MKILTISVAGYNIEKFIEKLMNSIISSGRINELEILIVNDGSKDKTVEIANKYVELYPNDVKLIDKENGGHGSTINAGIKFASCKYFKAIDGDDWFDSEGLRKTVDNLANIDADLIINDFMNIYESDNSSKLMKIDNFQENLILGFDQCYKELTSLCYHNIIYKTEILKNNSIHLTEHSFYVDNEYVMYPLQYIKTVFYYPVPLYCYRLGREGQSVSVKSLQKNISQLKNILVTVFKWYGGIQISSERKWLISYYISSLINFYFYVEFTFDHSKQKLEEIIEVDDLFVGYDEIYHKNVGKAVGVWRKSRKVLYWVVWEYFRMKRKSQKILGDI